MKHWEIDSVTFISLSSVNTGMQLAWTFSMYTQDVLACRWVGYGSKDSGDWGYWDINESSLYQDVSPFKTQHTWEWETEENEIVS